MKKELALLLLLSSLSMMNSVFIAFMYYQMTIMRIDFAAHTLKDAATVADVQSLQEWRKLTQSNRFTNSDALLMRNELDAYINALIYRVEALERAQNERAR